MREYIQARISVTETLSIRIDTKTKQRLDALSKRSKRSKSFLAAEAIAAYLESQAWQLGEVQAGVTDLDCEHEVSHEKVSKWLNPGVRLVRQKPEMKVVWSRRAIRHLVHLRAYIERDSELSAALVANRILKAVELLQSHPGMGRPGRVVAAEAGAGSATVVTGLGCSGVNGR